MAKAEETSNDYDLGVEKFHIIVYGQPSPAYIEVSGKYVTDVDNGYPEGNSQFPQLEAALDTDQVPIVSETF